MKKEPLFQIKLYLKSTKRGRHADRYVLNVDDETLGQLITALEKLNDNNTIKVYNLIFSASEFLRLEYIKYD